MKNLFTLIVLVTQLTWGQMPPAVQQDLMNFEPGELIVKLKDNVDAGVTYAENGKAMSSFNIGELLGIEEKIESSSVMFHQKSIEASIVSKKKMKAVYQSKGMTNPKDPLTMKNIFVLKTLNEQENIQMLIEQIKDNPNIEYAEPNYIYSIDDFEVGEIIYDETTGSDSEQDSSETSSLTIEVDDPLYSSQTNITATNIDDVWDQYTTGDGSQVIAILDTGVDYTHPDLEANIWINTEELNGVEGYDDDGNGYIDDVRGWDFINIDNTPLDDNMHGTHVAGIAGAVGNNGIGIAGAAWNVKLMALKVFQSTGLSNAATIADGIIYAYENGATVINMSFSGPQSNLYLTAMELAYSTSILVAAAGNQEAGLDPCNINCYPVYPAAYSFVLAVQDNAIYSNYDQSGPIYTPYYNLLNYELIAPGTAIMSTIPGGGYTTLTGTSMSAPLVAGALALYNELKPDDTNELITGNLINTISDPFVDFLDAIQVEPTPKLAIISTDQIDDINNQNGNGFFEPNEVIKIFPRVKNYWGSTDDIRVGIEFAEFEDQSKATIVQNEIEIGSIGAYATFQNSNEPLKILISDNVEDNVVIHFKLKAWVGENQEFMSEEVSMTLTTTNRILIGGFRNTDLILYPENRYLLEENLIFENASLIIMPGVKLEINTSSTVTWLDGNIGNIYAVGTKELPITFIPRNGLDEAFIYVDGMQQSIFKYCVFDRIGFGSSKYSYLNTDGVYVPDAIIQNCRFIDQQISKYNPNQYNRMPFVSYSNFKTSEGSNSSFSVRYINDNGLWEYNNVIGGTSSSHQVYKDNYFSNFITARYLQSVDGTGYLTPIENIPVIVGGQYGNTYTDFQNMYIGTSSVEVLEELTIDNLDGAEGYGIWGFENARLTPYEEAHGMVWKVELNGIDSFDNYLEMLNNPVGVGPHEFKVYFNREMDTTINPLILYGPIYPFTSSGVSEQGTWSEDGKIYTVNHEINIGASDGINKLYIYGAKDLDYFQIPTENIRFDFLIQSAGSASLGWYATAGLGNIALTWEAPSVDELDDVLGYNMYRYQVDADGVESTPVKLNETLIVEDSDDSTTGVYYTDFNVTEGETYFYKYNILRTSFEVTDYSSVVSTTPLTSTLGDSNGDFAVNVLDLVHDVDYILGNNPTPFIFLAGDVNADLAINVLDIVATVDIILNPSDLTDSSIGSTDIQFYPSNSIGNAVFTWEGNDLFVESDHNIGGLQLAFSNDFEYTVSSELATIEKLDYIQDDNKIVMLFSFNNTVISSGKTKLLTRLDETKDLNIDLAVVGTTSGSKLTAIFEDTNLEDIESPFQSDSLEFLSMIPNPTSGMVNLKYYLPEQMDGVVAKVYDIQGRLVWSQRLENMEGASETQMNLNKLQTGNYIVLISGNKNGGLKTLAHKMLIVK